ncbi:MAG: hypothetical protein KIB00_16445 [Paeniclostridium sordellii]|nr:hypothetical protein [Paeniclostridium sordellii]
MRHYIEFNNLNSLYDLGLSIVEEPKIPITEEIVEIDNGKTMRTGEYKDLDLTLKFRIRNPSTQIYDYLDTIVDWITNFSFENNDLYISAFKDKVFKVKKSAVKDPFTKYSRYGFFTVDLVLEPFRYLYREDIIMLKSPGVIFYRGSYQGECKIRVYGSGNVQLTINRETLEIRNIDEFIEIDSKLKEIINKNGKSVVDNTNGNLLILSRGTNNIDWIGNVEKIEILPRTAFK